METYINMREIEKQKFELLIKDKKYISGKPLKRKVKLFFKYFMFLIFKKWL